MLGPEVVSGLGEDGDVEEVESGPVVVQMVPEQEAGAGGEEGEEERRDRQRKIF